ncbi:hypothetical protein HMPREF0083_05359 [Aneurinibacillus aneurinilyticus ATCC 12856]|uniref:Uncharacterized protein n=1 Tax=Aneurinibacillus aneurinilyticus ATCC 12856 TaxID=649747 RepID=U1WCL2_ANEAE|nr:hypothetical protein HMPREF0083_05359 [Aneurinibacillus aneurinilyticus ATCC 12856]
MFSSFFSFLNVNGKFCFSTHPLPSFLTSHHKHVSLYPIRCI